MLVASWGGPGEIRRTFGHATLSKEVSLRLGYECSENAPGCIPSSGFSVDLGSGKLLVV